MRRGAKKCKGVQRSTKEPLPSRRPVESPTRSPQPVRTPGPSPLRPIPGAAEHPMQQPCRKIPAGLLLLCRDACPPAAASGRNTRPSNKPRLRLTRPALTSAFPFIHSSLHPSVRPNVHAPCAPQPTISQLADHPIPRRHARLSPLLQPIANKKILLPTVGEEDFFERYRSRLPRGVRRCQNQ